VRPWSYEAENGNCTVWAATEAEARAKGREIIGEDGAAIPSDAHGVARAVVHEELADSLRDVVFERENQRAKWGDAHDDDHSRGELALAAHYLCHASWGDEDEASDDPDVGWAIGLRKKHPQRQRLVIAAALLLAEIERLDRHAAQE
jgi:hypothetical protein